MTLYVKDLLSNIWSRGYNLYSRNNIGELMLPKEKPLEEVIENHLVSIGYEQGHSQEFDLENRIFIDDLF